MTVTVAVVQSLLRELRSHKPSKEVKKKKAKQNNQPTVDSPSHPPTYPCPGIY